MLAGKKHLAMFCDALIEGVISETIIPEKAFLPYVQQGLIKKFSREYKIKDHIIRYVCFTLPGHEWRADAFFGCMKNAWPSADRLMKGMNFL